MGTEVLPKHLNGGLTKCKVCGLSGRDTMFCTSNNQDCLNSPGPDPHWLNPKWQRPHKDPPLVTGVINLPWLDPVVVGDLNSNAVGSGARRNGDKVDYSLLPLDLIRQSVPQGYLLSRNPTMCLHVLTGWQQSGDNKQLGEALTYALEKKSPSLLEAFDDCAKVLEYGKAKYKAWNWAKGMPWSVPFACAVRHLIKLQKGQELDEESGVSHWGHVQANLLMLLLYQKRYPELNDMPFNVLKHPCGI